MGVGTRMAGAVGAIGWGEEGGGGVVCVGKWVGVSVSVSGAMDGFGEGWWWVGAAYVNSSVKSI